MFINNIKLKTINFNDLNKNKAINIKDDPIIGALLADLNVKNDMDCFHPEHLNLNSDDINFILELISALGAQISNISSNKTISEDIKPYIKTLKSLYSKSNMSAEFGSIPGFTTSSNDVLNLF